MCHGGRGRSWLWWVLGLVCLVGCDGGGKEPRPAFEGAVGGALRTLGLEPDALSVPKLGRPYSTPGRLAVVDQAMRHPLGMVELSGGLAGVNPAQGGRAAYVQALLGELGIEVSEGAAAPAGVPEDVPAPPIVDAALAEKVRRLLAAMAAAGEDFRRAGGVPATAELEAIRPHLLRSIHYEGEEIDPRLLMVEAYHAAGARIKLAEMGAALVRLMAVVEEMLPGLRNAALSQTVEWVTPLGRVRLAGKGDDRHSGAFALLIDLGGNDTYEEVGQAVEPGRVSVVIDLGGDDTVRWRERPGPGAGLLGMSLWLDEGGDDRYTGANMGAGVGLLGAGLLWDAAGNDRYEGGSMAEGVGQYGIGFLVDAGGSDYYRLGLYGQGFGGPGGIGFLADLQGSDSFTCGGLVPDQAPGRSKRHVDKHYLGMCQGYAFGIRPKVSGGVGVLLDREGDDRYQADLFAQGGSYWFGLGMLVDRSGNDRYEAFEHCQGESLHLGAGVLWDGEGDDEYAGYEHCQGVGMDRGVGVLYDRRGNDLYRAAQQSQGAGLKPFGVGLLIDEVGNDRYIAAAGDAQGFAMKPRGFPESQWPVGMLLDLAGEDVFRQPGGAEVTAEGRIQNKQGIAVDRPGGEAD